MRTTKLRFIVVLLSLGLLGAKTDVPPDLGWMVDSLDSVCHGHFSPIQLPKRSPADTLTHAKAKTGTLDLKTGRSVLTGQVEVTQMNQQANADRAIVFRENGKIHRVDLEGHIRLKQNGRLVLGDKARVEFNKSDADLHNAWYRYTDLKTQLTAWGFADQIQIQQRNRYDITNASYSTCAPTNRVWQITAKELVIEHDKGKGVARHAKLWWGDWPIAYFPYFSFATNHNRKSGFLMPSYSYSTQLGQQLSVPFYWNLAPNYDTTISTQWSHQRGVSFNQEIRYLSKKSHAKILLNLAPDDKLFEQFLLNNPGVLGHGKKRGSFHIDEHTQWTNRFSSDLNINAVSDDYFLQEYHSDLSTVSSRHLLRLGQVNYLGDYWQFNAKLQDYQTLQPLGQAEVMPVYGLKPQLTFLGETPIWQGTIFGGLGQFTDFTWPNPIPQAHGQRTVIAPYVSHPIYFNSGHITPKLTAHITDYSLRDTLPTQPNKTVRTIPQLQADTQWQFQRESHSMIQTLEPRVMALYVPYRDQHFLPLFDTTQERFTTDSLWRTNRFNGDDRIGDAKQIALGLQSRWLTQNGDERLRMSTGVIHYFQDRQLNYADSPNLNYLSTSKRFSPLANLIEWHIDPRWRLQGDVAIFHQPWRVDNGSVRMSYQDQNRRVVNFGYLYQHNILTRAPSGLDSLEKDHLIGASAAIPFARDWQWLGGFSYNLVSRRSQNWLAGAEYDSCCWSFRIVATRTQNGLTADQHGIYNNSFFLQLLLKGLGSVSNASPETVLMNGIPGYIDAFNQRGKK